MKFWAAQSYKTGMTKISKFKFRSKLLVNYIHVHPTATVCQSHFYRFCLIYDTWYAVTIDSPYSSNNVIVYSYYFYQVVHFCKQIMYSEDIDVTIDTYT